MADGRDASILLMILAVMSLIAYISQPRNGMEAVAYRHYELAVQLDGYLCRPINITSAPPLSQSTCVNGYSGEYKFYTICSEHRMLATYCVIEGVLDAEQIKIDATHWFSLTSEGRVDSSIANGFDYAQRPRRETIV